jgi:TetR/AcrR family transcriptional regulator, transcriptional repressor for nem operon
MDKMARPREFDESSVLDAVMDAFWQNGYEATSAQHLVEATGLGRGSLYNAYSNKDGLFEQALQRYNRRTHETVALLSGSAPIKDRVRRLLLSVVEIDRNARKRRGCLATNSAIEVGRDPRFAQLLRQNFRILEAGLERSISAAQSEGQVPSDRDPAVLATYFLNTIQGLRVMTSIMPAGKRAPLIDVIEMSLRALG